MLRELPEELCFIILEYLIRIEPLFVASDELELLHVLDLYDPIIRKQEIPICGPVFTCVQHIKAANVFEELNLKEEVIFYKLAEFEKIKIYEQNKEEVMRSLDVYVPRQQHLATETNTEKIAIDIILNKTENALLCLPKHIVNWALSGSSLFKAIYKQNINTLNTDFDIFIYNSSAKNYAEFLIETINNLEQKFETISYEFRGGIFNIILNDIITLEFIYTQNENLEELAKCFDMNYFEAFLKPSLLEGGFEQNCEYICEERNKEHCEQNGLEIVLSVDAARCYERNYTKFESVIYTKREYPHRLFKTITSGMGIKKLDDNRIISGKFSWVSNYREHCVKSEHLYWEVENKTLYDMFDSVEPEEIDAISECVFNVDAKIYRMMPNISETFILSNSKIIIIREEEHKPIDIIAEFNESSSNYDILSQIYRNEIRQNRDILEYKINNLVEPCLYSSRISRTFNGTFYLKFEACEYKLQNRQTREEDMVDLIFNLTRTKINCGTNTSIYLCGLWLRDIIPCFHNAAESI